MRIGIDVRYLSHGLVGGVHTYIKNFVSELVPLTAGRDELFLYADTKRPFELTDLPGHVTVRRLPYRNGLSSVYHDLTLQRRAAADQVAVFHHPANYGFGPASARTVVTLHDALNIIPLSSVFGSRGSRWSLRTVVMTLYLHACSRRALGQTDLMLTVSQHAKTDILRYCQYPADRIVPVPHAPTADMRRLADPARLAEVRARHQLARPFVLADGLKNPAVIARAWRRLPEDLRQRFEIVYFARRADVLPAVHEAVAAGHARLLVNPPREDLVALYNLAQAFVFPSWIEGFGIPVLEAMVCGAPLIASDRGSIPEVGGEAALYIDAEDDAQLASHLQRVLTQPAEAERLRALGLARAAQFSWRRTAELILEAYYRAAAAPPLRGPASAPAAAVRS